MKSPLRLPVQPTEKYLAEAAHDSHRQSPAVELPVLRARKRAQPLDKVHEASDKAAEQEPANELDGNTEAQAAHGSLMGGLAYDGPTPEGEQVAESDLLLLSSQALPQPWDALFSPGQPNLLVADSNAGTGTGIFTGTDAGAGAMAANSVSASSGTGLSTSASWAPLAGLGLALSMGATALVLSRKASAHQVSDKRSPQLEMLSGQVTSDTVTLTFDEALDPQRLPLANAFEVVQAGRVLQVDGLSVQGHTLVLQLGADLLEGAFTLAYRDHSAADDIQSLQDGAGNDVASFLRGVVSDGYVYGAYLYEDRNGNDLADTDEFTGRSTNIDGSFTLQDWSALFPLIAVGGINIDTGLSNMLSLSAPAGSLVLNPLTTLVREMSKQGLNASQASSQLAMALGLQLPQGTELGRYDPIAAGGATGLAAQKAAVQLATLLQHASPESAPQQALMQALAEQMAMATAPVALSNAGWLGQLLTRAGVVGDAANLAQTLGTFAQADSLDTLTRAQSLAMGLPVSDSGAPTVVLSASKLLLNARDQALVSFSFSEPVKDFTLDDVTVSRASLSGLTSLPGGRIYVATLTPSPQTHGRIDINLPAAGYTDLQGQAGSSPRSLSLTLDTLAPMVRTALAPEAPLGIGQTSLVTLNFDEPLSGFNAEQITVTQGRLSAWQADASGQIYTATFTPEAGVQQTLASLDIAGAAFRDRAGNAGNDTGLAFTIDTLAPQLSQILTDTAQLKQGQTALLTLVFSETVKGLTLADLQSTAGSLSNLQPAPAADSPTNSRYSVSFTPQAGLEGLARIELPGNAYADTVGNPGDALAGRTLQVDTLGPTLIINSSQAALSSGQTATLSFRLSERTMGLEASDISLSSGTLSQWQAATGEDAGVLFTATYTPRADFAGPSASFSVAASGYADLAGNAGSSAASLSLAIDTLAPQLLTSTANAAAGTIILNFDSALHLTQLPEASAFSLVQGGRTLSVGSITAANTILTLSGITGLKAGVPFGLTYTDAQGDGSAQIQDQAGNDAASFMQGIVADGYIRGARIYLDANGDGIAQVSEDTGITTRADGSFVLPKLAAVGAILAVGGVNTDTGVANTLTLSAPAGSTMITPLSTLVTQLMRDDARLSKGAANQRVTQALGLPNELDLSRFDALAASSTAALQMQKAAAKVATLVMSASSDRAEQASLIKSLAQSLSAASEQNQTVALDSGNFIASVLVAARLVSQHDAQQLGDELGAPLTAISQATTLGEITSAQSAALDSTAPAAPVLKQALPAGAGLAPQLSFKINVRGTDGEATMAGDTLTVAFAEKGPTLTQTVTEADVARGMVTVLIEPAMLKQPFTAHLKDGNNNESTPSQRIDDPNQFDLGAHLSAYVLMGLEGAHSINLPGIGAIDKLIAPLIQPLLDALAALPTLKRAGAKPARAMPLAAAQIELTPLATTELSVTSDLGDWNFDFTENPSSDFREDSDPDNIWGDFTDDDPFPPPPDVKPEDPKPPVTPENIPQDPKDFQAWKDKHLDSEAKYGWDPATGGYVHWVGLMRDVLHPMTGNLGNESLNLSVDALLALDAALELSLYITVAEKDVIIDGVKQVIDGVQQTKSVFAIDTEKSVIGVHFQGGLNPGNTVSGTLGPVTLTLTDQDSTRAAESAAIKNTGLEASATLKFRDNDAKKTDKLLNLDLDTFFTAWNEVSDIENFELGDWLAFKAKLTGQLSGNAQLVLDPSQLMPAGGNATAQAVLQFLRMDLNADLTVPLLLEYDSTQASTQDYGRLFLDNISMGAAPLLNEKLGPAVTMMDDQLGWLFDFKDFMDKPLPSTLTAALTQGFATSDLPSWMTKVLPGDYKDTSKESLERDIYDLTNLPTTTLNSVMRSVFDDMDFNKDGALSNFETIKGTVTYLYKGAKGLSDMWDYVSSVPGLKATLTGSGYGAIPVGILEGIKVITPALETSLQSILVIEQVLDAIDNLDQIGQSYASAKATDLSGLALNLGSQVIDFKTRSIQTLEKGLYNRVEDFTSPSSFNPEPGLGYEAAIRRLLSAADKNDAQAEPGGTGSYIHEHVFKTAGITGVTSQNVGALRSLLNSVAIDSARLQLNRWGDTVRTPDATDPDPFKTDGKEPQFGLQDEVDSYRYLFDIVNGKSFSKEWVTSVMPDGFDSLSRDRKYEQFLATHIKALGIPAADFNPSKETQELYLGRGSMSIFYDILDAQSFRGIDSIDKLQALWNAKNKVEDANQNAFASPKPKTPKGGDLSADELSRLKLPLLDPTGDIDYINESLAEYGAKTGETADKLFDALAQKVTQANEYFTQQRGDTDNLYSNQIIEKISRASVNNTAQLDGLSVSDFTIAGINGVSPAILPMLLQILDTDRIQMPRETRLSLQRLVDNINDFYSLVNDQPKSYQDMMNALSGIFFDPAATGASGAGTSNTDPFINRLEYRFWLLKFSDKKYQEQYIDSLDVLSEVLSRQTWEQVDTLAELEAVMQAVESVGRIMHSDYRLYDNVEKRIWNFFPPSIVGATTWNDAVIKLTSDTAALTPQSLNLLGFPGVTADGADAVTAKLKTFLLESEGAPYPITKDPITYRQLQAMVDVETSTGLWNDIFSDPRAKSFTEFFYKLRDAGFEFPILRNGDIVGDFITALIKPDSPEVKDLMTFTPQFPNMVLPTINLTHNLLEGVVSGVELNAMLSMDASFLPRITLGVDTTGLIGLAKYIRGEATDEQDMTLGDVLAGLPNSFYMADTHMNDGQMQDLPELELSFKLTAMLELLLGSKNSLLNAYANAKAGVDFNFMVDLVDPDEDGKARLVDLIEQGADGFGLGGAKGALDAVFDIDLAINALLGIGAGIKMNFLPKDGLPWDPVTNAAVTAVVTAADWFGLPTKFDVSVNQEWPFPLYNSATGESVFSI